MRCSEATYSCVPGCEESLHLQVRPIRRLSHTQCHRCVPNPDKGLGLRRFTTAAPRVPMVATITPWKNYLVMPERHETSSQEPFLRVARFKGSEWVRVEAGPNLAPHIGSYDPFVIVLICANSI